VGLRFGGFGKGKAQERGADESLGFNDGMMKIYRQERSGISTDNYSYQSMNLGIEFSME